MNIKHFYTHLSEKKFKFLTISLCGGVDLMFAGYIYHVFTDRQRLRTSIDLARDILEKANPSIKGQINEQFISEIWQLMTMSVITMLGLFLIIHTIVYAMHTFDLKMAKGYVKFYAWTTGVCCALFGLLNITSLFGIFFIPGVLLLTLGQGFRYREEIKKLEE